MPALPLRRKWTALSPLLVREARGRWRKPFGPLTLFLYTAFLAYLTWQILLGFQFSWEIGSSFAPGRRFLGAILPWLSVIWLLVAPIVTCASISTEREQGMLPALMLTRLSPREIVCGKWLSAMAFQCLLLLVPAPVWLMGLSMGGVAPWEVWGAIAIQAATAAAGSALGLLCSASARTSFRAFGGAFTTIVVYALFNTPFLSQKAAAFLAWASPLTASIAIFSPSSSLIQTALCVLGLSALTWFFLESAAHNLLSTPLEQPERQEYTQPIPLPEPVPAPAPPQSLPVAAAPTRNIAARPGNTYRSRWEEYPIGNAIARREIRRRTRYSEPTFMPSATMKWERQLRIIQGVFAAALIFGWWFQGLHMLVPYSITSSVTYKTDDLLRMANILLIPACLWGAALGASTFSREREQGTMHEITNLPLRSWEIAAGFLQASLWLEAAIIPPLWLGLPLMMLFLPLYLVLPWFAMLLSMLAAAICVGLFFSWIGHHTNLAVAGALAAVVGYRYFWFPGPTRDLLIRTTPVRWFMDTELYEWIQVMLQLPGDWGTLAKLSSLTLVHLLIAGLFFGLVTLALEHTRRDREAWRLTKNTAP